MVKDINYALLCICNVLLLINCSSDNRDHNISEILVDNIVNDDKVFMTKYIEGGIEYVKLESKDKYLLKGKTRVYLTDSLIVAFGGNNQIFLFERTSGKLLREIGHRDRAPNGYKKTVYSYPFDDHRNTFFTKGWEKNSFNIYDNQGELINKINVVTEPKEIVTSFVPLNDTLNIGYIWNYNGKQKNKLIFFDNNGVKRKTFPQYNNFDWDLNRDGLNIFNWDGWFYNFNNDVYFFERNTDTLFQISENKIFPKYVFQGKINVEAIFESDRFLFFIFQNQVDKYIGIFSKLDSETKVVTRQKGFANDIDNFIDFNFYSINSKGEAIGIFQAYEVKKWFDENPEKAKKLPSHLQKLRNIKELDNPVVMIVKLKE